MASLFDKVREAGSAFLDAQIVKSKRISLSGATARGEFFIDRKSITAKEKSKDFEMGYRDRRTTITFDILRQMAMRDSIVAAIIQTRVNQIKAFCQPQPDKYSPGFKIVMRDEKEEPNEQQQKEMFDIQNWILNTGYTEGRKEENIMNFTDFMTMTSKDVLTYDQLAIETIDTKQGTLGYFYPVSAGTIRFAAPTLHQHKDLISGNKDNFFVGSEEDPSTLLEMKIQERDQLREGNDPYGYVQIYQGQIVRAFFPDEMILRMMNPTTELDSNGYSIGPLELLANIVSYHLYSEAHNRLFFVQGFASRGILHIEGDIPPAQLDAFRRQWAEQVSGASNSWRTPVLAGGGKVNWIPLSTSNRDMEWSNWMEYLIKIICAIYGIDPKEINFDITKNTGGMVSDSGRRNDVILKDSKDRGLRPLLKFYESVLNEDLIRRYDEEKYKKYKFIFCGLDIESKSSELERHKTELESYKTVNEVRKENDLEEIPHGDILLNATYTGWRQFKESQMNQKSPDQNFSQEPEEDPVYGNQDELDLTDDHFLDEDGNHLGLSDNDFSKSKLRKSKFSGPKLLKIEYYKK